MRLNDFRIKAFLILVSALCLYVTGCGNAEAAFYNTLYIFKVLKSA